jgi:hypothetical protein
MLCSYCKPFSFSLLWGAGWAEVTMNIHPPGNSGEFCHFVFEMSANALLQL